MTVIVCRCPSTEGLSYEEIINTFNLMGKKSESKNCCENAGYICSNLDKALRKAYNKKSTAKRNDQSEKPTKEQKKLRKRVLSV